MLKTKALSPNHGQFSVNVSVVIVIVQMYLFSLKHEQHGGVLPWPSVFAETLFCQVASEISDPASLLL